MGIISVEQSNRLFWLGRYTERALLVSRAVVACYDRCLDTDPTAYKAYLSCMGLTDSYGDGAHFAYAMLLDKDNPASASFSLERAFDNAIVLREEIGTQAFSFIQMALDSVRRMAQAGGNINAADRQTADDMLLGFIGAVHEDECGLDVRSIISLGRATERLDLSIRLRSPYEKVTHDFSYFCFRLRDFPKSTPYRYNTDALATLCGIDEWQEAYTDHVPELTNALNTIFIKEEACLRT